MKETTWLSEAWDANAEVVLFPGACEDLLAQMPDESVQLVVTSPPYNIGKSYETKKSIASYLREQRDVIEQCVRVLKPGGSICWQVGNFTLKNSSIIPLDLLLYPLFRRHKDLYLKNRIIWHYEHGLHASVRFSGRHETILWFTKGVKYTFNLDPVRVPQKYPGKRHSKGPNKGKYSGNPLGKNPGDVWIIPNVKHNHVEKTIHPCQFPVELVERLILALTNAGDLIVDPYMGVATSAVAAIHNGRRAAGAEIARNYFEIGLERVRQAYDGELRVRPRERKVYIPNPGSKLLYRELEPEELMLDAAGGY